MEIIKIIGVGFTALILTTVMKQYKPEFTVYISLVAGIIILYMIMGKLAGIVSLLSNLSKRTGTSTEFLKILLKITGISIITEFAVSICNDSGEGAIASKIDLGGKIIIISMSIPIVTALLELIITILP